MTKVHGDPFHHVDYNAMVEGINQNGVLSGLAVSQRGAGANMSVDVALGTALIDEDKYTEAGVTNVAIDASEAGKHRKDTIIYDTATSAPIAIKGTSVVIGAAAVPPSVTADDILLAVVYIGDAVATILDAAIYDGRIFISAIKDNWTAVTDPDNNDDTGDGYEIGSRWVNTSKKSFFVCVKATAGVAVWRGTYSAASAPTVTDDDAHGFTIGSQWVDTAADVAYICTDATTGAAIWITTTPLATLITKSIAQIATEINSFSLAAVPAGMMNAWAVSLNASIFNEAGFTPANKALVFNEAGFTPANKALLCNHTDLQAAVLNSICDNANISSATVKAILDVETVTVASQLGAMLEGTQLSLANAATVCNAKYTAAQKAAAFDNTIMSVARKALIFNEAGFSVANKASVCREAGLSIANINAIIIHNNLTDDNAQQILSEITKVNRDLTSADNIYELLDDWNDNKLTGRDGAGTVSTGFTNLFAQKDKFRPVWTQVSGTTTVSGGKVVMNEVDEEISTPSTFNAGTWEFDDTITVNTGLSDEHPRFIYEDANNYWEWGNDTPGGTRAWVLRERITGTNCVRIQSNWSQSTGTYTIKVTRDSSGNFEGFVGGVSKGTYGPNTDIITPVTINLHRGQSTDAVNYDNLKVY